MVEPKAPPDAAPRQRRAGVRLATWLSIVPGLGQLYNRQPRKAAVFLCGVLALFFISLNIPGVTGELLGWWGPHGRLMVVLSLIVAMLSLLLFIGVFLAALTLWYGAMHDARLSRLEINGEREPRGRWWLFRR